MDKLEFVIATSKKRIDKMENFIVKNGLTVPSDEEIDLTPKNKEVKIIFKYYNDNFEKSPDNFEKSPDNLEITNDMQFLIEAKYYDIKEKYQDIVNKLNLIEKEKENMSQKLIEAFDRMPDYNSHEDKVY